MKTKTSTPKTPKLSTLAHAQPARPVDVTLAAWESTRALREAVAADTLRPFTFDYTVAVMLMQQAQRALLPLRAQLVEALPKFDVRALDELGTYCSAALYAHARVQPSTPLEPAVELSAAADRHYTKLMQWSTPLVSEGLVDGAALDEIRKGSGWRDRAEDLRAFVVLLMVNWDKIRAITALTDADLDLALTLADRLLARLAQKEATASNSDVQRDRRRVMAVAINAYEQVRRAVSWLRWDEGDAEELAPSVYKNPFTRSSKPATSGEDKEEADTDTNADTKGSKDGKDATKRAGENAPDAPRKLVVELTPDGRPVVPQDDPMAKD